ncbi:MAG TPA: polyamine aminopropyltransferase [Firmicutes bacterium]|nr:polyamine aminopropyltransferase [Bacillota bacterium]
MDVWFTENQGPGLRIGCQVKKVLASTKSAYQEIAVYETSSFGRLLALDDVIQTTERDEFAYHEMIVHVPMFVHGHPRRVLIIGGGDGGCVREVLKHPSVQLVKLIEIDPEVTRIAREFLPGISHSLSDNRVSLEFRNGIEYLRETDEQYDVIIVDCTDPVGPAVGLFSDEFYSDAFKALSDDGVFVEQTESPFYNLDLIERVQRDLKKHFPVVGLYLGAVPTYPGGLWSYSIATKGAELPGDPLIPLTFSGKYYNAYVHRAAFVLPEFVRKRLGGPPVD